MIHTIKQHAHVLIHIVPLACVMRGGRYDADKDNGVVVTGMADVTVMGEDGKVYAGLTTE